MLAGVPKPAEADEAEKTRIMLGFLESVERGGEQSQRRLASQLGVALGLVNAYLKPCITKGLVKVSEAPARRHARYLTPHGIVEKSCFTVGYLSCSFSLCRRAKGDCAATLSTARERRFARIAIFSVLDLAKIAAICALDSGIAIVAALDTQSELVRFAGVSVVKLLDDLAEPADGVLVTGIRSARETAIAAIDRLGRGARADTGLFGLSGQHGGSA